MVLCLILLNKVNMVVFMLGVRLDEQLENRLTELAEKKQRSKSYIAKEALKRYIREEEIKESENQETLKRWEHYQETGEVISNDDMMVWLDSWGTEQEKRCPVK
jgi:predicted transcriptional regulator